MEEEFSQKILAEVKKAGGHSTLWGLFVNLNRDMQCQSTSQLSAGVARLVAAGKIVKSGSGKTAAVHIVRQ